ncbi:MAG: ribonucleotide-diphosphate reductase subunit beta, partial [Acinetobacter sp.]|nr:ribonucleotide-diphosphate reductase subunit beta [Acinetobacter sp.]
MSILSWDDFEDDSQKPAVPEHKSARIEPQKATDSQMVSDAHHTPSDVAAAQPATAPSKRTVYSTDSMARASAALETLDVAPGLEELEMGAQRVQVDDKAMINCRADL